MRKRSWSALSYSACVRIPFSRMSRNDMTSTGLGPDAEVGGGVTTTMGGAGATGARAEGGGARTGGATGGAAAGAGASTGAGAGGDGGAA